jgi:hypothetical protein
MVWCLVSTGKTLPLPFSIFPYIIKACDISVTIIHIVGSVPDVGLKQIIDMELISLYLLTDLLYVDLNFI